MNQSTEQAEDFPYWAKLPHETMSIRTYAAIHTAQGLVSNGWSSETPIAKNARRLADRLLQELDEPQGTP
jgi:hypothetical protein